MNHHEIEQQDIIERYVRHQLKPEERRAFQEHYFACDDCFAAVESTAKFIAGVQRSARVGVLAENARAIASTSVAPWWASWFKPMVAFAAMACLLLAVTVGWLVFRSTSGPGDDSAQTSPTPKQVASETETPTPTPADTPKDTPKSSPDIEDKPSRKDLENKIARNETPAPSRPVLEPKGNVVVALDSSRGKSGSSAKVSPDIASLTLRAEVEPGRYDTYQMQILDSGGRVVKTLSGLRASSSGALATSVPAKSFPAGKYSVKLYGVKKQQKDLVGDYDMTLRN
ncbi:MAG TPA: zf-HC2 domain-containing protein [Blastocatellia bacterium]|nr:zf-HC2 domain-containing protein [Blastocatellia bacterium]